MLGAIIAFISCMSALFWYIWKEYGGDDDRVTAFAKTRSADKRRNRRKGKGTRKKAPSVPSGQSSTDNVYKSTSERDGVIRDLHGHGGVRKAKDDDSWPTLESSLSGRNINSVMESGDERKEELAALHATMLDAKLSAAGAADISRKEIIDRARGKRKSKELVSVGDKVEARFQGGQEWFPASVTKMLTGGLVNLVYDDGERETRVHVSLLRVPGIRDRAVVGTTTQSDLDREPESLEYGCAGRSSDSASLQEDKCQGVLGDGWQVKVQKPKKAAQERAELRMEASVNMKNRLKRQKKRERELAARDALRKKL